MKKTIILKESELIKLIESAVTDIQEQTAYTNSQDFQWYDTDKTNVKVHSKCTVYQKNAERIARIIVNLQWEKFTDSDLNFYNRHMDSSVPCVWMTPKTVNEYIHWIAGGEKGICDNPWHCILPVAAVGALFITGPAGWAGAAYWGLGISIGIEAIDAKMYYDEGDEQMAGLVMGLAVLPVIGKIVKKFPFVKNWVKGSPTYIRFINGEAVSVLEFYQMQTLKANQQWIKKEVLSHVAEKAAKESIEIAGTKITKESLEEAMKKGYMDITVDGITHKITQDMFNGLTQKGINKVYLYTAKQQNFLIKFADMVMPYVIAAVSYNKIYDEVAESGVLGPQDLIRKRWGIEPRDKPVQNIVNAFFMKMLDPEADISYINNTYWDSIKTLFHSDSSGTDGELMVQAIKHGWNPLQIEGKGNYTSSA